jgi:hypothetical protein
MANSSLVSTDQPQKSTKLNCNSMRGVPPTSVWPRYGHRATRIANPIEIITMAGTHYTLSRDQIESKNPMDVIKTKACLRCTAVKPNTFTYFGKKLWQTRQNLTTTDICIACQKAKVSASMKAKWASKKLADHNYEAEGLRMARATYEANEAARKLAEDALKRKAEIAFEEGDDDAPGIKRITLG